MQLVAFLLLVLVVVAGLVSVKSCTETEQHHQYLAENPEVGSGLIALPNHATIVAPPGSVGARMAAYLASDATEPRNFVLGGRQFDLWSGDPTPATKARLVALTELLKAYPDATAIIIGHTDNQGTDAQNQALSLSRAQSVLRALVARGIAASRLTAQGEGGAQPIASNDNDAGRAQNRRIDLILSRVKAKR